MFRLDAHPCRYTLDNNNTLDHGSGSTPNQHTEVFYLTMSARLIT